MSTQYLEIWVLALGCLINDCRRRRQEVVRRQVTLKDGSPCWIKRSLLAPVNAHKDHNDNKYRQITGRFFWPL